MTSHDVRDMLDLPSSAGPRPAKKQKISGPRPNLKGLQREVQRLGGDNPIAIVPQVPLFKKRRQINRKPAVKWELEPFRNSARKDGLILKHWRQKPEPPVPTTENGEPSDVDVKEPEIKDSTFAKFNVQVNVPAYDDEQYESILKNDDWTKEETDYLMTLVQEFDLRWPVIWDRYEYVPAAQSSESMEDSQALIPEPKTRDVEELKARYYYVAAKMMSVHRPEQYMSQAEFSLYKLMESFNPEQERSRKRFAEAAMSRSPEERREEENLLIELKRIMSRTAKLNEERQDLYQRLEAPATSVSIQGYTSSQGLHTLIQAMMNADKSKKRKSLLGPEGVSPAPPGPSTQHRESMDRKDSIRESISGASGKKSSVATPTERRQLTKEEEHMYGISHHERLTGGPHFRHDKVTKQLTAKSTVQSQKIANILSELGVPVRLKMPTAEVVAAYEALLASVNTLLDAKKVVDKMDGEIKVLDALKKEREKKERRERGEGTPEGEREEAKAESSVLPEATAQDENDQNNKEAEGDTQLGNGDTGNGDDAEQDGEDNPETAAPSTRASSAAHKRSASVLSQVSDKSSKRQRK